MQEPQYYIRLSSSTAYYLLILKNLFTKYSNFLTILEILHPQTAFISELLGGEIFPQNSQIPQEC